MNKFYFIIPALLLGGFIFLFRGASAKMEIKEAKHKAAIAAKIAIEDANRREIEKKSQEDAAKRQEERIKDEQAKIAKNEKNYSDAMAKLKADTETYAAETAKSNKAAAELEISLLNARINRDKYNRESFELSKQVELAKISRRNAELEIQRLIEMVGTKASTLASMPPPPPPPVKK